jgi:hypothetical protein
MPSCQITVAGTQLRLAATCWCILGAKKGHFPLFSPIFRNQRKRASNDISHRNPCIYNLPWNKIRGNASGTAKGDCKKTGIDQQRRNAENLNNTEKALSFPKRKQPVTTAPAVSFYFLDTIGFAINDVGFKQE